MSDEEIIEFEAPESQTSQNTQAPAPPSETSASDPNSNRSSSPQGQGGDMPDNTTSTTTAPALVKPRVGGIQYPGTTSAVVFCGGTNMASREEPKTAYALRDTDPRSRRALDQIARDGLPLERRLAWSDDTTKRAAQVVPWLRNVRDGLESLGVEPVFHIWDPVTKKETSLFQTFGNMPMSTVKEHVKRLREGGMPWPNERADSNTAIEDTVKPDTFCPHDIASLRLSAVFLQNAVDNKLWTMLDAQLPFDPTGPEYLVAVTKKVQGMTAGTVRRLCNQLDKLELKTVPGEDVQQLNSTVGNYAQLIIGSGVQVADLCYLSAKPFSETTVDEFKLAYGPFLNKARPETDMSKWDVAPSAAVNLYDEMRDNWAPAKDRAGKKEQDEVVGLIATLQSRLARLEQKNGGTETRSCYRCGQVGHLARNCPNEQQSGTGNNSGGGGPPSNPPKKGVLPDWRTKPPGEGAPTSKTVSDTKYTWCAKCRQGKGMWTVGKRLHSTSEHVKGGKPTDSNPSSQTQQQGRLAVVNPAGILECTMGGAKV